MPEPDPSSRDTVRRKSANAQTVAMHKDQQPQPPPATVDNSPLPPQFAQHPRYRVARKLSQSDTTTIYLAEQIDTQRRVALAVVPAGLADNAQILRHLHDEVRAAQKLSQPNVLAVLGTDEASDAPRKLQVLVNDYVESEGLAEYIKRRGPLPMEEACRYARQVAAGLHYAMEQGAVHGDIRPEYLLLSRKGEMKIMGFGWAHVLREHAAHADAKGIDYLAPERVATAHAGDFRSDIYSLGCTLYQMLTAQLPFGEGTEQERLARHAQTDVPDVHTLRPDLPSALSGVIKKMLAKKPEDRYATPAALAAVLGFYSEHHAVSARVNDPLGASATVRLTRNSQRASKSSLGWAVAAILSAGVFLALALWKLSNPKPANAPTTPATSPATSDAGSQK